MNDLFGPSKNPEKQAFKEKLFAEIRTNEIAKHLGLSFAEHKYFRHAVLYANILMSDHASPLDLGQIYHAINQIESEVIPNVPILDAGKIELPVDTLKAKAALLLTDDLIKGLDQIEIKLLRQTLSLTLGKEDLNFAGEVIQKLKSNSNLFFPVTSDVLEKYLELNRRKFTF